MFFPTNPFKWLLPLPIALSENTASTHNKGLIKCTAQGQSAVKLRVARLVAKAPLFPLSNFAIDGSTSAGAKVAILSLVNSTASTKHINTEFIRKKIDKLTGTGRTFHLLRICMCSAWIEAAAHSLTSDRAAKQPRPPCEAPQMLESKMTPSSDMDIVSTNTTQAIPLGKLVALDS